MAHMNLASKKFGSFSEFENEFYPSSKKELDTTEKDPFVFGRGIARESLSDLLLYVEKEKSKKKIM